MNPLKPFVTTGSDGVDPGLLTSEFWAAAATEVLALIDAFGVHHFTQQQDALVLAGIPMIYMIVRSAVKAAAQLGGTTK